MFKGLRSHITTAAVTAGILTALTCYGMITEKVTIKLNKQKSTHYSVAYYDREPAASVDTYEAIAELSGMSELPKKRGR